MRSQLLDGLNSDPLAGASLAAPAMAGPKRDAVRKAGMVHCENRLETPRAEARAGIAEQIQHESFREVSVIPLGAFLMRTASRNGHGGFVACSALNP